MYICISVGFVFIPVTVSFRITIFTHNQWNKISKEMRVRSNFQYQNINRIDAEFISEFVLINIAGSIYIASGANLLHPCPIHRIPCMAVTSVLHGMRRKRPPVELCGLSMCVYLNHSPFNTCRGRPLWILVFTGCVSTWIQQDEDRSGGHHVDHNQKLYLVCMHSIPSLSK